MESLENGLVEITNKEKRYFMQHLRLFRKDYDDRYKFAKSLQKYNRKMIERKMSKDTSLMNNYDHCMMMLRQNNLSDFIIRSDYFISLLGYLRRK